MTEQRPEHLDLKESNQTGEQFTSEQTRPDTDDGLYRLVEWLAYFLDQKAPLTNRGTGSNPEGRTWTYGSQSGISLEIQELVKSDRVRVRTIGLTLESHKTLAQQATAYFDSGWMHDIWWYAAVDAKPSIADQSQTLHFMRGLDHARRVTGWVALGRRAIFDFAPPPDQPQLAFFSPVSAKLFFLAPGIHQGPFSTKLARGLLPNLTACASYCLGTPLDLFPSLRPADAAQIKKVEQAIRLPIPQLAIEGVPIWSLLEDLTSVGAVEAANRTVRAIASYETAMRQGTLAATVVHLVSAIEALARPNLHGAWKQRTVKRFKSFLSECVPDVLDATLKHANFSTAFPDVRTTNQLTSQIYDTRSLAVHSGQVGEFYEHFGPKEGVRIALIADIARAAILRFVQRPFSSLVGHPTLDPVVQFRPSPDRFVALRERADRASCSVEEYVLSCLFGDRWRP